MTIEEIIKLLSKQGVNSKMQVINLLQNISIDDLISLKRDINEKINLLKREN